MQNMRDNGMPSLIDRLRYFYMDDMSKSRIEQLYNKIDDEEGLIGGGAKIKNHEVLAEYGIDVMAIENYP